MIWEAIKLLREIGIIIIAGLVIGTFLDFLLFMLTPQPELPWSTAAIMGSFLGLLVAVFVALIEGIYSMKRITDLLFRWHQNG